MIYSSCNIYQRTFRKGLFITQYICSEHSARLYSLRNIYAANIQKGVGDRFIAPASSTKTIGCNLQNITNYNAYGGNKT